MMSRTTLTISSRNYSSWSLRGWLLCHLAGLEVKEELLPSDDPATRAELLLLSPTVRVPRLRHEGIEVWDTLAIAEYLHETFPQAGLLPGDRAARALCRSICGEMHAGFANLRAALPMNIKARYPGFKVWAGAQADIDHIVDIWGDCLKRFGGPFLFGGLSMADAMYAPVCTRLVTYDVTLEGKLASYMDRILALPVLQSWIATALAEPEELEELEVEF